MKNEEKKIEEKIFGKVKEFIIFVRIKREEKSADRLHGKSVDLKEEKRLKKGKT